MKKGVSTKSLRWKI